MCSNMNVINNSNARTDNVLDNLNPCKYFVNLETDAAIAATALHSFGMEAINDSKEKVVPLSVLKGTDETKKFWKLCQSMS